MTNITKGISDALTGPTIRVMDLVAGKEARILKAHNSQGFVIINADDYFFCEDFREAATHWLKIIKELE